MSASALLRDYVAETAAGVAEYGCLIDVYLANDNASVSSVGYIEDGTFTIEASFSNASAAVVSRTGGQLPGVRRTAACYDDAIRVLCSWADVFSHRMKGNASRGYRYPSTFCVEVRGQSGALLAQFVVPKGGAVY